ncbi:glycogen debranching enzyme family protein [bacterium]|nr:glycogen debranching enzyme family protein [bacterium]
MGSQNILSDILITFPRETCSDYYFATQKEWLETNGIGGFASSTIIGANVRRYHGLLVASLKPPTHRFVLLSKLEENISINGKTYEFSTNQYPFIIYPEGHKNIERFEYDVYPRFIYRFNDTIIEKSVIMLHGENSTIIRYRVIKSEPTVTLTVRPLCAFRDYHSLSHENSALNHNIHKSKNGFSIHPYLDLPAIHMVQNTGQIDPKFFWYKNSEYRKEQERGLEFAEDVFSPVLLNAQLCAGESLDIVVTTDEKRLETPPSAIGHLFDKEILRRVELVRTMPLKHKLAKSLALAADSFIVQKQDNAHTVIAGYHWFSDWGRDTMISLTGLTLSCGKYDIAKSILRTFSNYISEGMLPNRFPDLDESPEYNNVDGTLWYFIAIYNYLDYTKDLEFVRNELYVKLKDIIDWHLRGTRYHIKMDSDGLLFAGEDGVQLTWMDAKVGDWVVTPRTGKPVEINALWYNALCIMRELAKQLNHPQDSESFAVLAEKTKQSFNEQFWNADKSCLYDFINGTFKNEDIRPNQIFAVSLPFEILDKEKQKDIISVVQRELLTCCGLRSLSALNDQFIGTYSGDPYHRDGAYHQGTVWPWLIGAYLEAYLKVHEYSSESKMYSEKIVRQFEQQLTDGGIGTVSEIVDGSEPHLPKGCISQAWSVAEILRILEILEKN